MLRFLCFLFLVAAVTSSAAQDPVFSQFYAMPLQINPAFAGSSFAPRIGAAYRHQWPGFQNAYRTYGVFYEQSLGQLNSGIGFYLEGDNAGDGILRTSRASALYAYQLMINDGLAIKIGAEAGVIQTSLDWDKLSFPDQIDPINGAGGQTGELRPDFTNKAVIDISAGMLLLSEKFHLGVALKHLNTPDEGILLSTLNTALGIPVRYTLHGGFQLTVKEGNKHNAGSFISPNFLFLSQGPFQQLNVGAFASLDAVFAGAWFRHTFGNADAAILSAGFREGVFKMGLSYDLTLSELSGRTGGSWELTLGLQFDQSEKLRKKRRADQLNDCLRMFQ